MALRIDQPIDSLRRCYREPHRHQLAGRRWQTMLRRLAMHMRAIGVGNDQAGVGGKNLARQILGEGEEQPVAMRPVVLHFWSARKSSIDDLISTIQISPRSFNAARSARRPEGSGNSLMQENPSDRNSRAVPRAIASAVSD